MFISEFFPIPIEKFLSGKNAPVDIHLLLGESKFIKVVNAGDAFDKNRLSNYQQHKLDKLYIAKKDVQKFIDQCMDLTRKLLSVPKNNSGMDISALIQTSEYLYMQIGAMGLKSAFPNFNELTKIITEYISKKPLLGRLVLQLLMIDDTFARHGLACANVASILMAGMNWKSERNMNLILMACLLHDIGLISRPELMNKTMSDMTEEEKTFYTTHPHLSLMMLQEAQCNEDSNLGKILLNHHELPDGSGFPMGLHTKDIHPMALPVIISNRITHLLISNDTPLKERSLESAVRYLKAREEKYYPDLYWQGLESWQTRQI